jgi:hypothetical protein
LEVERDLHRTWTGEQDRLRKLISARDQFQQAIQLFLSQHTAVHTAAISSGHPWSLHDEALAGLSEDQIKACPPKQVNSIAWLLWHITRIEDMTINSLVYGKPKILDLTVWRTRLGIDVNLSDAKLSLAVIFEGQLHLCPVSDHLAIFDLQVQLQHFCDSQVAQRFCRHLHCIRSRLFPGLVARPHQLDNFIDGLGHIICLLSIGI